MDPKNSKMIVINWSCFFRYFLTLCGSILSTTPSFFFKNCKKFFFHQFIRLMYKRWFGSKMMPYFLWSLIWTQTVCKSHHQWPSKFNTSRQRVYCSFHKFVEGFWAITFLLLVFSNWNIHDRFQDFKIFFLKHLRSLTHESNTSKL